MIRKKKIIYYMQEIKKGFDEADRCNDSDIKKMWIGCAEAWELLLYYHLGI